jgi:hypothetical protein
LAFACPAFLGTGFIIVSVRKVSVPEALRVVRIAEYAVTGLCTRIQTVVLLDENNVRSVFKGNAFPLRFNCTPTPVAASGAHPRDITLLSGLSP